MERCVVHTGDAPLIVADISPAANGVWAPGSKRTLPASDAAALLGAHPGAFRFAALNPSGPRRGPDRRTR